VWHKSVRRAALAAAERWVRVKANLNAGMYLDNNRE
jgi:hypothetical protein